MTEDRYEHLEELLRIILDIFNQIPEMRSRRTYDGDRFELLQLWMNGKNISEIFDEIQEKGNIFNLSGLTQMHDLDDWTVPFYDTKTGNINFIAWNSKKETPINVSFIINQSTLITINNVKKYEWKITDGENINNINEILTIVDNKIKQHIDISTPELKEKFKRNNQTQYI